MLFLTARLLDLSSFGKAFCGFAFVAPSTEATPTQPQLRGHAEAAVMGAAVAAARLNVSLWVLYTSTTLNYKGLVLVEWSETYGILSIRIAHIIGVIY